MRLINYRCNNLDCPYEKEELFRSIEIPPKVLEYCCPICGGILYQFNLKNNRQVWRFNDRK